MPEAASLIMVVAAVALSALLVLFARRDANETRRRIAAEERAAAERVEAERARAAELAAESDATAERLRRERAESADERARIAGLSQDEALAEMRDALVARAEDEAEALIRRAEAEAQRNADERARRVLATAAQRLATQTTSQAAITIVPLPSEEMKGRIIGKEGRNIRTFEAVTGVNLIIDETPAVVTLSSFDPERREIAQVALEHLVEDGRIHPQRIEDAYQAAVASADERAVAAGAAAAQSAGVSRLHPDLIHALGMLRLRTSYGQNVLAHLIEASHIAASVAAEIGADVEIARRAALLHDIGKGEPADAPGSHAAAGARLAARAGESDAVVNAIAAHHDEAPADTVEAVIVQIADAASAARPGARRDEAEQFFERMGRLEELVAQQPAVAKVLAMSSGRDVRVIVEPSQVDDAGLDPLARTIARAIESELSYPGQIKITVVRELRAEAIAG